MSATTPPTGYRLLTEGERIKPSTDIYYHPDRQRWCPVITGGKWSVKRHWPVARPGKKDAP